MRRVTETVPLSVALARLKIYRDAHGPGPHKASCLADVIWPGTHWVAAQGAGAAAVRVLRRLGCEFGGDRDNWGWMLRFKDETKQ